MEKYQRWIPERIRRAFATPVCLLLIICAVADCAFGRQADDDQGEWRATVKVEVSAVYSEMSTSSPVVRHLREGDTVAVILEITGAEGAWYSVSEVGQTVRLGYMRSRDLEQERPASMASWRVLPPPPPPEPTPDLALAPRKTSYPRMPGTKAEVKGIVESFFRSRFGHSLPVSAFGQSRTHDRMGYDHRNAFDVALHPDSAEGRSLIVFLRSQKIPFITFRKAVRGAATGPHIHVGQPSPRK